MVVYGCHPAHSADRRNVKTSSIPSPHRKVTDYTFKIKCKTAARLNDAGALSDVNGSKETFFKYIFSLVFDDLY